MKMNATSSRMNFAIRLKKVRCVIEGELVELLLDSTSRDGVIAFVYVGTRRVGEPARRVESTKY